MTAALKPIISADISIMMSIVVTRAMPRSPPRPPVAIVLLRMSSSRSLLIPVDERQVPEADHRRQVVAQVVAGARRLQLRPHADVHVDLADLARVEGDAADRVRQV